MSQQYNSIVMKTVNEILGLIGGSSTSEMVEADIEPFVNLIVKFKVFVANLLRS